MTVVKIKKQKAQKRVSNCENRLEATQLNNKINYLEKNKIDIDNLKRAHREFI